MFLLAYAFPSRRSYARRNFWSLNGCLFTNSSQFIFSSFCTHLIHSTGVTHYLDFQNSVRSIFVIISYLHGRRIQMENAIHRCNKQTYTSNCCGNNSEEKIHYLRLQYNLILFFTRKKGHPQNIEWRKYQVSNLGC